MPYNVELPDGTLVTDIPDDMPQDEVRRQILAAYPQFGPKQSTVMGELKRGAKQLISSTQTGIGAITSPEEAARAGVERAQRLAEETGEGVSFAPVKEAYEREGILSALGEAASQVPRAVAQMAAPAAATIAGGKAGALAGAAVAPALGPFAPLAPFVGGALGAGAALYPSIAGANIERQAQEQLERGQPVQIDRPAAYGTAVGQTALEAAGTGAILGKRLVKSVLGIADDAALASAKAKEALVQAANRSMLASAGMGAARGATEIPVEIAQSVLERAQAGLDVTSPEALAEYGESAYQAALGGMGLGAVTGIPERAQARAELGKLEVPKEQQEAQRRFLAARERERTEALAPKGYEDKQGLLFEPTKVKAEKEKLPTDPAAIQAEFNALVQQEQTPETQAQMAKLAQQYEAVMAKQPEAAPQVPAEQMGLGLEGARESADMYLEIERLKQQPKTPEVKARINELTQQIRQINIEALTRMQAEQAQRKREEKMAAESAFAPQPPARPTGYTAEGQGRLFTPTEMRESGLRRGEEKPVAEPKPTTPGQLERAGQRRLPFEKGEKAAPKPAAEGTAGVVTAEEDLAPPVAPVPEPKLAPKYPAELQPVMDKLTAAGVRPETQTWAENARNRPFLRKLMDMAPEAAPEARKALKLKEGSSKAEVFDALFPTPRVPAFEPAPGAGESRLGLPGQLGITPPEAPAPRAGKPVRPRVVPAGRAAPAPAAPEVGAKPALEKPFVAVKDLPGISVGPGGKITPKTIAEGKPLYHETNVAGLDYILRHDRQVEFNPIFVSDNPDLAIGQGANKGVRVVFRPDSLSGTEHRKPGTGDLAGREYKTDIIAPKAVQTITVSAKDAKSFTWPIRQALKDFTSVDLGNGQIQFNRKGLEPQAAPEAAAKPLPSTVRAEQFWKDTAKAVGGKTKPFSELTPVQRAAWREAVKLEDVDNLRSEYERIVAEGPSKAEEIRAREQAKREAAEAKRVEQERRKAEKEAEAKRKAEAVAERERAKREVETKRKAEEARKRLDAIVAQMDKDRAERERAKRETEEAPKPKKVLTREKAEELLSDLDIDPDTTKSKVKALAKRMRDAGLIEDADINALERISKDRDMGAEDLIDELRSSLAATEAEAKRKTERKGIFGESDKHPEWAKNHESSVGGRIVYSDEESALLRGFSVMTGQYVYVPVEPDGRYKIDVDSKLLNEKIPAERLAKLREAKAQLVKEDAAKLAKYPDGPFTGVKGNVASSDGVDARYTDYLRNLMQDLGLGDIRVFMLHPEDLRTLEAADKYKLYADWASARSAGLDSGEDGSVRVYGPDRKSFYISLRPGMSEQRTLETIAHELGHLIQRVAYDTAPSNVQKEIRAEYEQWLTQNKGKTARELIQALRNRETAAAHVESVSDTVMASELTSYWTSFSEWFADNVSRWATTDERPVSVVEKFFKAVADKLRALVAAITGQDYAPAKTVAAFLNKMGPANPISWAGTADTTAQKSRAPSPTEGIAETSELMEDMPTSAESTIRKAMRLFLEKDDVPFTTRFRTEVSDAYATVVNRLNVLYDGKVRDELTKSINPEMKMRQAQAAEQLFNGYLTTGGFELDPLTGQWMIVDPPKGVPSHKDVLEAIKKWGDAKGMDFKLAYAEASKMLEAQRLNEMLKVNKAEGEDVFTIHKLSQKDDRTAEEQVAAAMRGLAANPEVQEIGKMMDAQRAYMIDKMVEIGRISKDTAGQWKDASGYVPFDRIDKFFDKFSPKRTTGRGLAQLGSLPKLVGTNRLEVGNVFDNQAKLMTWMLKQTIKQDATYSTLRTLADIGQATDLKRNKHAATNPNNVVKTYRNGIEQYFEVKSHWDVEAFKDLQGPKSYFAKVFAGISNILRKIVTVMPPFVAKQVTDDIQRAFVTSGVEEPYKLVLPAVTNFLRIAGHELVFGKSHPITVEFAKKGLVGDVDYNASNPAEVILFNLGYSQRGWLSSLHHRLESVTRASDLAIRKAIYDRTLAEEKDAAVATARAREFINFRRRGASQSIGSLIATVPFFNAYIQSTDLLLRSATGRGSASVDRATAKRLFWLQASKMLGFSLIYALVASGDDEYEKLTLDQRANNWVMGGVKLPAPGDLAALFKVPVEATVHYMSRLDTPEEQQASEAVRQTLGYALEQYVGRVSPIPQAVRPIVEAWANRSVVTGRKLVGTYQEGLPAPLQTVASTSELAKAIAKFAFENIKDPITDMPLELSPIVIDNTLRGYLGGAVPLLNMLVDQMFNPNKTDRPLSQYWFLSQYLTPEVPQGPKEEFYDLVNKVMPVKRALDKLSKEDMEAAMKYAKENEDKLKMAELVNIGLTDLRQTREYIKYLDSAEGAKKIESSAERLKIKQQVQEYENKMLDWVRKAKTQIFLNSKN